MMVGNKAVVVDWNVRGHRHVNSFTAGPERHFLFHSERMSLLLCAVISAPSFSGEPAIPFFPKFSIKEFPVIASLKYSHFCLAATVRSGCFSPGVPLWQLAVVL